jgi:hypothetical protein
MLALYLAKGLLPEVRMKERKQREMHPLAQTRDLLVKQRSALKAKINNLLSAEGINLKLGSLSSNKALVRVLAMPLSPVLAAEARVLVCNVRSSPNATVRTCNSSICAFSVAAAVVKPTSPWHASSWESSITP